MRLVTFGDGRPRVGVIGEDGSVVALDDVVPGAPPDMIGVIEHWRDVEPRLRDPALRAVAGTPADRVRLLAPIPRPHNIFAVGWNYADHFMESKSFHPAGGKTTADMPKHPTFFMKSTSSVVGPDAPVRHPGKHSSALDWEAELAVVIGKPGRDIPEDRALEHVFGYTIANDVSVRDHQRERHGGQWIKGKIFDTHCPLGPWIVTADEIPDPQVLRIGSRVGGETMQDSSTEHMVFGVARILSELSVGVTIQPGDVVITGTPSGVGDGRTPPRYVKVGEVMEMWVEPIGVLRNKVVGYDS
ncbi:MAG: fumarylacetoacetate hydrolase family protein [Chloroflexota bacterium]|nr:fumarylacetoacetate hydrolase family protein [Chloroflexota bacterium]